MTVYLESILLFGGGFEFKYPIPCSFYADPMITGAK